MKRSLWLILWGVMLVACTPPVQEDLTIELQPGVDTIEVGEMFEDAGARAYLGETPSAVSILSSNVNPLVAGRYEIVYQAVANPQVARITRVVDVIDTTAPVVSLRPGIDTILIDSIWIDAGIDVTDNSLLPYTITIEGAVGIGIAGEYQIVYVVVDAFGNTTRISRFVNVVFG
jgi:hypothetical protein